jgi:hypothetical protein
MVLHIGGLTGRKMNKRNRFGTVAVLIFGLAARVCAGQNTMPDEARSAPQVDGAPGMQSVSVNAVKDPEIKSYRAMLAGLDAFDKHRALAPDAPELRFVLSALADGTVVDFAHTKLSIRGDTVSIPVAIDANSSFVLPRNQQAADDGADLILDLRKGRIRGRPDVRTPGISANMRRLGDLRLECEVRSAIAKTETNFLFRGAMAAVTLGRGLCNSPNMHMGFFAGKNIERVTLVSDSRREPLAAYSGAHYFPPVGDRSWPDSTLIEFTFADAAPSGTP